MQRGHQIILISSTIVGCWLGMQALHELGHILGARITGARVTRVVLSPATFSRTDVAQNSRPVIVAWAGPITGVVLPIVMWLCAHFCQLPGAFVLRFFAGFCLIANGMYIGFGSFGRVGDCGEMLRHGSPLWSLWVFGALCVPIGFALWHRQGIYFGLGEAQGQVSSRIAYASLVVGLVLLVLAIAVGGK